MSRSDPFKSCWNTCWGPCKLLFFLMNISTFYIKLLKTKGMIRAFLAGLCGLFTVCVLWGLCVLIPVWSHYESVLKETNKKLDKQYDFDYIYYRDRATIRKHCWYGQWEAVIYECKDASYWYRVAYSLSWIEGIFGLAFVVVLGLFCCMICM